MPPRLTGNAIESFVLITGSHTTTLVTGEECILLAALEL